MPRRLLRLEVATPTPRPLSGRGCHALTWRSHGHSLAACLWRHLRQTVVLPGKCTPDSALKAKFHYTSWFGASSELAPNMFGASSELASVMEFGFKALYKMSCLMDVNVSAFELLFDFATIGRDQFVLSAIYRPRGTFAFFRLIVRPKRTAAFRKRLKRHRATSKFLREPRSHQGPYRVELHDVRWRASMHAKVDARRCTSTRVAAVVRTMQYANYWATVCKTVALCYQTVVLSVCLWRRCIVAKRMDGSKWNLAYK